MRLLVINPFADTESHGRENLERIARPDTEFDIVNIADVYPIRHNQWLYFRYMCTDGTLEKVLWAEREGYDAVFISCNLDIGLYEARQLVDIPVTATLESAALVAHMMAASYSLVTVDYQNGKIQESLLTKYGLRAHFASQRPFGIDAKDLYPDRSTPGYVLEAMVDAARACVREDGAEVVIPGCTLAGSLLTHDVSDAESVIGAPVVDGMITGFKMAEMMAELHAQGVPTISRRGWFEKPPQQDVAHLRGFLGRS
jgi:Asp/Glu/hydantoin racemase